MGKAKTEMERGCMTITLQGSFNPEVELIEEPFTNKPFVAVRLFGDNGVDIYVASRQEADILVNAFSEAYYKLPKDTE